MLFGDIVAEEMMLSEAGRMIEENLLVLPHRFPYLTLGEFAIMPNHFHGIFIINNRRGEPCVRPDQSTSVRPDQGVGISNKGDHKDRPYGTLDCSVGRVVQAFKSLTTNAYIKNVKNNHWPAFPGKLWQRNYYERIIRDEKEWHNARQYIRDNPLKWATDQENPTNHPNVNM